MEISKIFTIIIALVFVGTLLPIGLDAILGMVLPSGIDPNLETLILVVIPLSVIIGIVVAFLRSAGVLKGT